MRRLLSLALGVLLTLALIEGLAAASQWLFVRYQDSRGAAPPAEGELRILAIGESTTAVAGDEAGTLLTPHTAYPAQLERILNERQDQVRVRVLNNGMMGGTSRTTLARLDETIRRFEPHVIIAMMGIKDTPDEALPAVSWLQSLRTVQLAQWLCESISLRRNELVFEVSDLEDLPEDRRFAKTQLRKYLREIRLAEDPEAQAALGSLEVATYLWFIQRHTQAEQLLRTVIAERDVGYNLLARVLATDDRPGEAVDLLRGAIERHPEEGMYRVALAEILIEGGDYSGAEAALGEARAASEGFLAADYVGYFIALTQARLDRERGDYAVALKDLSAIDIEAVPRRRYQDFFPPLFMLLHAELGTIYYRMGALDEAEQHLLRAVTAHPGQHANMWLLGQVYREQGRFEEEEALRRKVLTYKGRLGEYYELAKLFQLYGQDARIPGLIDDAVARIPSLTESYRRLYRTARSRGIRLVVMQYPSFGLELLHKYAPPAEGVSFIDNEHVFDADPNAYFYEPGFPHSFSHYTEEGAEVLAEQVADHIMALYDLRRTP